MNQKPKNCTYPDCFACPYDDCRYDRLEAEDFKENYDEPISKEKQMARDRANRYAKKNRAEIRKKSLEWYYENREKENERGRKYCSENKERVNANKRKRWAENPEHYRKKQRDYRNGVSKLLPHCDECRECILVENQKGDGFRRLCVQQMRLIEQKVSNSPLWCEKRKGVKNVGRV